MGRLPDRSNPGAIQYQSDDTVLKEREVILTCRPLVDNCRLHGDDSFHTLHSLKQSLGGVRMRIQSCDRKLSDIIGPI